MERIITCRNRKIADNHSARAKNRQPWKYYVYAGSEKNKLLECMEIGLVRERDGNKLLPNSQNGLPDAFNTLRIMKEAPILIIIENANGLYPYSEIDADNRVTESKPFFIRRSRECLLQKRISKVEVNDNE